MWFVQNRLQRYEKKMKNTNKTVKKHHSYWVLLLTVLFSGAVNAKVNNYVGAYANVGEWTLLPSQSNYGPSFGVAGGAGFLYELQAGGTYSPTRFLFDVGVGAQGGMTSYIQSSNMTEPLPGVQTDLDGDPFTYIYEIQDRHDQYNNLAVQVPIMIGVQQFKKQRFKHFMIVIALFDRVNRKHRIRNQRDALLTAFLSQKPAEHNATYKTYTKF